MGLGSVMRHLSGSDHIIPAKVCDDDKAPTERHIYQSRFNHGPNLGGMFLLEKWISGEDFYPGSDKSSELDAVKALYKKNGKDATREKFEAHWKSWIEDSDWKWMQDHGVTAVRVPIGYWIVGNGKFTDHTPFDKYASVYSSAWDIFKAVVIEKAKEYGIAVLVDLHGLPGGANREDHSGTTSGKAELWDSRRNIGIALDVLEFIASDLLSCDNVCGIQVVNEAVWESDISKQKSFYRKAINRIRAVNEDVPVVISDGWDLQRWIEFVQSEEARISADSEPKTIGTIIDTHVYRCFSDADKAKSPDQLIAEAGCSLPENSGVDIMVGEYSCVLDGATWDRLQPGSSREDKACEYGRNQSECFKRCASAGNYFWTYKFSWGSGGEWGFREMVEKGAVPSYGNLVTKPRIVTQEHIDNEMASHFDRCIANHRNYWEAQDSKKDWQHWRFEEGFRRGWADAMEFYRFNFSQLGRVAAWKRNRLAQHIQSKSSSDLVWVWDHGYTQALEAFRQSVLS